MNTLNIHININMKEMSAVEKQVEQCKEIQECWGENELQNSIGLFVYFLGKNLKKQSEHRL